MLIDQDIVPRHSHHHRSVLQPICKCLPLEDIVRLKAGDELIVVIPAITSKTDKGLVIILWQYINVFQRVIKKSLMWMNLDERTTFVAQVIQDHQEFRRDGQIFVEYPVRVRNYAERENFEREHADSCVIDMYWRQGVGVNLVICGYTTQLSVLLELRHVAHLQVYMKTSADSFLSHQIGFSNNARNSSKLVRPFLEQLLLFDGCQFIMLEILWKYYRSITTSNQWRHQSNQMHLALAATSIMRVSTANVKRHCRLRER